MIISNIKFNYTVGKNLKYLRKENKWSQTKVGEKLGVTFQQIQKYEKGTNGLSGYRLYQFLDIFNISFKDLTDDNFITKRKAFDEVKSMNNGMVKHKDFMNTYTEILNDENNS